MTVLNLIVKVGTANISPNDFGGNSELSQSTS